MAAASHKSYNKKRYREATALTLPLSSPLRPARGITNHGLRFTNCTFQAVCAVYIESHRYNMMKPGSILICFIQIAVIFLIAAMT